MSNFKPYFKYIKDFNIKFLSIITLVIFINATISIFVSTGTDKGVIIFTSQLVFIGVVMCAILGVFYSITLFSSAMSIRADRVGYLKACLLWGIISSVVIGVLGFGLDTGCKAIIELITGKLVEEIIPWVSTASIKSLPILFSIIIFNLLIFSAGFMLGAIWYRLKIIYSIIIFIGIPGGLAAYIINLCAKSPETLDKLINSIICIYDSFMANPVMLVGTELIGIAIFVLIGVRLLVKAPTKEYAYDLI